jgi:acyl-CoA thioester hydrolase
MDGFRFTRPHRVTISDINYVGHVSNAAVLEYFQEARVAYLAALGEYSEQNIGDGCGLTVAEARVRYRAEMFHGQALELGVGTEALRRTSFRLSYRIEGPHGVTAEGETTLVAFDYTYRRPRRLPDALRETITRFEGRDLTEERA